MVSAVPDNSSPGPDRRVVIPTLGITQIFAWGATYYLPAVLAVPISVDTGWPLPWIVAGLSIGLLVAGLLSPRAGKAINENGGRLVLAAGTVLLGIGLVALAAAPNLPLFLAAWLVIGCGMSASLYDAAFSTLAALYREGARTAIGTLTLFGGFSSTICWPLSAFLEAHLGWRGTCLAYAGFEIAVALPLLLVAVPRHGSFVSARPGNDRRAITLTGLERLQFALMAAVLTIGGAITALISVYLLTLLQTRGVALATAVSLGALIGPSQVGARIVELALGRHYHPSWTFLASTLLIAAGMVVLALSPSLAGVALVGYGAGNGIWSIARGTLPLVLFGPERYAPLMGRLALPALLSSAAAPILGAALIGRAEPNWIFVALVVLALGNVVLMICLQRTSSSASR